MVVKTSFGIVRAEWFLATYTRNAGTTPDCQFRNNWSVTLVKAHNMLFSDAL